MPFSPERFLPCGVPQGVSMGILLLIVLIVLLVGASPNWNHSRNWGYGPSGLLGLILIIFLCLLLFDVVHWRSLNL
jgi:hypothetical protein